jgi:hypothetical protein
MHLDNQSLFFTGSLMPTSHLPVQYSLGLEELLAPSTEASVGPVFGRFGSVATKI